MYIILMELKQYLKEERITHTEFARRSGIPQPTIWRILNRVVIPSPQIALKIEKATAGTVTRMELLYPVGREDAD